MVAAAIAKQVFEWFGGYTLNDCGRNGILKYMHTVARNITVQTDACVVGYKLTVPTS